jgi:hypothetical protein
MQQDAFGNAVTGGDAATLAAIDDFGLGLLAYERRAERVLAAAARDPDGCLVNVYAGFLWMLLEAAEGASQARRHYAVAERASAGINARERLNLALLGAWADDDLATALALAQRLGTEFPRDLVALKLHHYLEFNRGNAPEMLRAVLTALAHAPEIAYVHGMAAFAYEQCHLLDEAEAAARAALALLPKEPWAQHALAHVLLTRGEIDAGAAFLESCRPTWTDLNSFMWTHLWWHLALFYLSQGRHREVLEIYDRHCWGIAKDYSQDQIGAVSLLARAELAGIDVGTRWQDVGAHLAARAVDTLQPFLSLQYLYGLARAQRPEADRLLAAVERQAQAGAPFSRDTWRAVGLPAARGLLAHARRDYESAWTQLSLALPRLAEIGGSHAQRDLFEQILLDAALHSGRLVAAQQRLELRRASDQDGVPVNTALASVYEQLQLPALALQARRRAEATGARHA